MINRNVNVLPSLDVNGGTKVGDMFWVQLPVGLAVSQLNLVAKLDAAGLDKKQARALPDSFVFNRAVIRFARGKMRDRVEWSQDRISIQVSARVHVPDGIDYVREATVTFDRSSQSIVCADPIVQAAVEAEMAYAKVMKKTADVTAMIKRLIEPKVNKTIFPIKGGTFFALEVEMGFVAALEAFVISLGGFLYRWPIAAGFTQTVQTVQVVVVDSFAAKIEEARKHMGTISSDSRKDTVARAKEDMQNIYDELQAAGNLIGNELGRLIDDLARAEYLLKKNIGEAVEEPAQPTEEEVQACQEEIAGRQVTMTVDSVQAMPLGEDDDVADWIERGALDLASLLDQEEVVTGTAEDPVPSPDGSCIVY